MEIRKISNLNRTLYKMRSTWNGRERLNKLIMECFVNECSMLNYKHISALENSS